jgi:hypothetical protein
MSVTNPIITINGVSLNTSQVNDYTLSYNKLWKNANRDMNGNIAATMIGVYPNISVTTNILDFAHAQALSTAINDDFFSVTYWDTQTSTLKTAQYYAADHDVKFLNECKYGQVNVQLVAVSKANYI